MNEHIDILKNVRFQPSLKLKIEHVKHEHGVMLAQAPSKRLE